MKMKKPFLFLTMAILAIAGCNFSSDTQENKTATVDSEKVSATRVTHPDWSKNANIYEVNLRQFTREGNIRNFMTHLPRLKNMGVDILWFMPVHPIGMENRKGPLGSYYAVQDYTAVNPEFGNMKEFKNMVNLAHDLGMKVIIDWVANHTAWDHNWVSEHPEFYDLDSTGQMYAPHGWEDVVQLDFDNKDLWPVMIGELEFWVRETNIDGFRCDVAGMVPTAFWDEARIALDNIKPVFMLAEAEKPELVINAFDMDYGWHFHHLSNLIARGDTAADVVSRYFDELKFKHPAGAYKMNFTTNHDENSWNGTVHERYGEGFKAFAVLMATVPGMPLIYTGQEAALDKRLKFFEKDPVDWKDYPLEDFYRKLLNLKKQNAALWNGNYGGAYHPVKTSNDADVVAFIRTKSEQSVFVVLNLSEAEQEVSLSGNDFAGEYTELFDGGKVTFVNNHQLKLKPWDYRVYVK
jgi:glycosidase